MPLIRLSEMYYILAECADDMEESARQLSVVRSARGIDEVVYQTEEDKMSNIEKNIARSSTQKDNFGSSTNALDIRHSCRVL